MSEGHGKRRWWRPPVLPPHVAAASASAVALVATLANLVLLQRNRSGPGGLWLVTTNDNLDALEVLSAAWIHDRRFSTGAVNESRHLKPSIREVGRFGIPMRDEIILERVDLKRKGRLRIPWV